VDVQERLMYNNLLGSISEDGCNFYYQNPLDSSKVRYPWHGCPCCVGNIPRTLLALKDLAYSLGADGKTLYAIYALPDGENLPAELTWTGNLPKGKVTVLNNGKKVKAIVKDGKVTVKLPKGLAQEPVALKFSL
jgi:DUF1680 family protein